MKFKNVAAFLLMITMLAGALCIGAWKGWRQEADEALERRAALDRMLEIRLECAHNVLTVAGRHLPESDAGVQALRQIMDVLAGNAPLSEKAAANAGLTRAAQQLLTDLSGLPSVQQDARDRMYAENYLPQMLLESGASGAAEHYNQAVEQYNQGLQGSFSGMLARLFGTKPLEAFR